MSSKLSSKILLMTCFVFFLSCGLKTKPTAPKGTNLASLPDFYSKKIDITKKKEEKKKKKSK